MDDFKRTSKILKVVFDKSVYSESQLHHNCQNVIDSVHKGKTSPLIKIMKIDWNLMWSLGYIAMKFQNMEYLWDFLELLGLISLRGSKKCRNLLEIDNLI